LIDLAVFDFSVFAHGETWVQLLTLLFLELVLGVDNLVFICLTTDRLPAGIQALGRRLGLVAALVMRVLLLCFASWIISLNLTLFTLPFALSGMDAAISGKDLILFAGGAYLVYKGIVELREKLSLKEEKAEMAHSSTGGKKKIGLMQAVGTIALMDVIFSLDSVITAVGMADILLVMILAVMLAIVLMLIFADPIAHFIGSNPEIKILALGFIVAVGIKLVIESLGFELHIEGVAFDGLDLMLYFGLALSLVLTAIQMSYNKRLKALGEAWRQEQTAIIEPSDELEASQNEPGKEPTKQGGNVPKDCKGDTR
jgi:predicted tellurium resistance membrane protein TerC